MKDTLRQTLNNIGYMYAEGNEFLDAFLAAGSKKDSNVADLGCAFGCHTILALEKGAHVTAIDMCNVHLLVLKTSVKQDFQDKLSCYCLKFPDETSFRSESFDAGLRSFSDLGHLWKGHK